MWVGIRSIVSGCYTCTSKRTGIADMKVVSFSEARNSLKTVLDRVVEDADYTIVTRRDADDVVVMSLESFNSLMETVHLLKSPANAAHLERSIAQFRAGKAVERHLLDD
jgi:antitoxin YefM